MQDADPLAVLLGRIACGDTRAMRALYDGVGPAVHRFILTRLKDPHDAADVLQETMLEVWRAAARFEGRSSARTWIFGIARNKASERLRRAGPETAELDETIPDETPDAEAVIAALEDGANLRDCIDRLTPAQRSAVHLAYFADVALSEIAEMEGCSVGTVKSRLHHARKLLLHCLSRRARRPTE